VYLSADERVRARRVPASLAAVERAFASGERAADALEAAARAVLAGEPELTADYVAVADPETLDPVGRAERGTLVMLAVRAGRTRLLDNVVLGEPAFGTGLA
jgi:pantoate--beta-alanine ligase